MGGGEGGSCHSAGSHGRWPNMFAHAMGHSVFRGTAGAAVEAEGWAEVGGVEKQREEQKVWWPHVAVAARCRDTLGFFILNTDEEAENKLRTNTGFDEDSGGL